MFVVLLKFSSNKNQASQFMDAHNAWLQQGFDDQIFILSGSLQPAMGGAILAHNTTFEELRDKVHTDPFVIQNIVSAEILEITPGRCDEKLSFLKA